MLRAALGLEGSAAAFGARLRLNRIQLIGLLQKADRLPRASQKLIIDTRPDRRHGPIWNAFNIVARLNQNRIDPFEPGAFPQSPQTDFLKLRGRLDLAPYSFSGHCVTSSVENTEATREAGRKNQAASMNPVRGLRHWHMPSTKLMASWSAAFINSRAYV